MAKSSGNQINTLNVILLDTFIEEILLVNKIFKSLLCDSNSIQSTWHNTLHISFRYDLIAVLRFVL